MKAGFYYLVASLPELSFDRPSPLSQVDFLALCAECLPKAACRLLAGTGLPESSVGPPRLRVVSLWLEWENTLRHELAGMRGRRLGWGAPPDLSAARHDPELAALAGRVMEIESPRTAEDELDRARWTFLDSLEFGRYFDLEALVVYWLKLRILARRAAFNKEAGREKIRSFATLPLAMSRQAATAGPEVTS